MADVARVFYKIIKLPKGSSFFPTDLISEIELEKEASSINYGSADEAEYLLPMCEITTLEDVTYKNRPAKIMEVSKQKNPAETLSQRVATYREKIIEYLGEEKLIELEQIIATIRELDGDATVRSITEENFEETLPIAVTFSEKIENIAVGESIRNVQRLQNELQEQHKGIENPTNDKDPLK